MSVDMQARSLAFRATEDRLLLDEFTHRTANEIAAAIAALRIARRMPADAARETLLDEAVGRLEAFGEVHRLLSAREHGIVDAGDRLRRLCCALARSRCDIGGVVALDVANLDLHAATTRCLLMVGSELITNAMRHALSSGGTRLIVRLALQREHAVMIIADDGPGIDASGETGGTGLGRGIVRDLIDRAGGRIEVSSGRRGTRITVLLPVARAVAKSPVRH